MGDEVTGAAFVLPSWRERPLAGGPVHMSPRRSSSARLAAAAIAGLVAVSALATIAPAHAVSAVTTTRIAGNDRYATAAAVATKAYTTADTVIVASGLAFPDALAGSALASRQTAPVLLTDPATLSTPTSDAIATLKATKAVILGGTSAVSQAVEDALAKKVSVSRISGNDRYDTAAKIAAAIGSTNIGSTSSRRTALIATGSGFADALAGGPLSAAGSNGVLPVLLVSDTVPAATKSALTDLGITQTIILGGTGAVSTAVENDLKTITGNAPTRLAGADRYATAAAIAVAELTTFGFTAANVYLGNGVNFADALAAGPLGGKTKSPIVLTDAASLPTPTKTFLSDHSDAVVTVTALGGTAAISDATLEAAKTAASGTSTDRKNETIVVSPQDKSILANDSSATRSYTATGVTGDVDIVLVSCSNVTTSSTGNTVFANADADGTADGTSSAGSGVNKASTNASISTVNGAPNLGANDDYADKASPASGTVKFDVKAGSGVACVVPVVFADSDSNNGLAAGATGLPSEAFGTGGIVEFQPAAAATGQFSNVTVQSMNDPEGSFSAAPTPGSAATYFYDDNDTYKIGGAASNKAAFVTAMTTGDTVSGDYRPGATSTFDLTDAAPAAPGLTTASAATAPDHSITLTFTDSSTATTTSYNVYRAPGTAVVGPPPSVTCPPTTTAAGLASYTLVGNPVVDDGTAPLPPHTFKDTTTTAATSYCYIVRSVDSGNVGPPPAMATSATASA